MRAMLFLLPSGEGGAKRRMRVRVRIDAIADPTLTPAPLPVGEGFKAARGN
jgi:hypothetical protein